ncbi:hypothetical protein NMY22_g17152 [Coprinellus aureogranulatus]|nr:hypothetical protein NMY22_g17152 [Coprinellus aureogranulatus]
MVFPTRAPPEVWLQIFHFATQDSSSSLERLQLGPNQEHRHHWPETAGYKQSLAVKVALAHTCRAWNELATPLLYHHISVTTDLQCERLRESFSTNADSRRRLVRRLDVVRSQEANSGLRTVIGFCRLFPELRTLVLSLKTNQVCDPSAIFDALTPKIEHLLWTHHGGDCGINGIPLCKLVRFFDNHPNLTTVGIPYSFQEEEWTRYSIETFQPSDYRKRRWSSIRAMILHSGEQARAMVTNLPSGAFPNLDTINASYSQSETSPALQEFIDAHVPTKGLKVLGFGMRYDKEERSPSILRRLAEATSALEVHLWPPCYDVPSRDAQYWFEVIPALPSQVTVLGLHYAETEESRSSKEGYRCSDIKAMHHLISQPWTKVFPNLETIRLMVGGLDFDFFQAHDSTSIARLGSPARSAKNPIRVEDVNGRVLAEFTSGMCTLVGGWEGPPHCY